jgi:mannan endo-1,4-beta-mannosidase
MPFWDGSRWINDESVAPPAALNSRRRNLRDWLATIPLIFLIPALIIPLVHAGATSASLTVSGPAHANGQIGVSGQGFPQRDWIELDWDGSPAGMPTVRTTSDGQLSATVTIPAGTSSGVHVLSAVSTSKAGGSNGGGKRGSNGSAPADGGSIDTTLATATVSVTADVATPTPTTISSPSPTPSSVATPTPTVSLAPTPTAASTPTPTPTPTATPTPSPTPTPTPTPTPALGSSVSGFVVRCGVALCLNGQPYRFTGLNIYNANSQSNCWYTLGSGSGLDSSLTAIGTGQEAFRSWFFQRLATANGARDWSAFDHTLAVAAAHGERVVATLTNQWGDCENASGSPLYKPESWYGSAYKSAVDAGMTATYREWVREVVTRYRDNPTILAWQMINEGEAKLSVTGGCSSTAEATVHSWAVDISGLIKSIDSNHLVSLGTIGNGQCGTSTGTSYEDLHSIRTIDLCEYHDYDSASSPMPGDQWNGLATRLAQCQALGKPMFVGEMGIKTSDVSSLSVRAADMTEKFAAQFGAGVVGELPWAWAASGQNTGDGYSISPDDPMLSLLKGY